MAEVEREITGGKSAGRYFDLIAGTSTGGIIALGLSIGLTAEEISSFYIEEGQAIFPRYYPKNRRLRDVVGKVRLLRDLKRYRYERDVLESALNERFGNRLFGHAERRLVIPSFDSNNEVFLLKTPHHPDFKQDWKRPMTEVALATAAAPTYFRAFDDGERRFVDGGVWANNPIMCAVVEAMASYDLDRHRIEVLSLGCGENGYVIDRKKFGGGLWHWRDILSAASQLGSQNALGQAGLLLGADRILRLDRRRLEPLEMDDFVRAADELPGMAKALFDENRAALERFFAEERPRYDAVYGPRAKDAS